MVPVFFSVTIVEVEKWPTNSLEKMSPRTILFTDLDGTIIHYPDSQASWGDPVSSTSDESGEGETVLWKEKVKRIEKI